MTPSIFVDTSFYVASLYPSDELHERARFVTRGLRGKLVTTQFIVVELGNHFSTRNRLAFEAFIKALSQSKTTTVLPATAEWVEKGTRLYTERLDKEWSLTDCISFAVMEELGIKDALTYDHHFDQAGFRALLRD